MLEFPIVKTQKLKLLLYLTTFLLLLSNLFSLTHSLPLITQKNGTFIDNTGRSRIFHGVNVVYKMPPYIPSQKDFDPFLSLNPQEDIQYLKKFGFNLVRLGVIWEAIETAEGQYNWDLLEQYRNLVNLLGANGIYVILDAHQDVISRETCGEGIPVFYTRSANPQKNCDGSLLQKIFHFFGACKAMHEYEYKLDANGLPDIEECKKQMFGFYHTTPEVTDMYKKLYNNENNLLDKFINFWKAVATVFKGNEYVLGYDIWNEPFPGGVFETPFSLLIPGKADDTQLIPFYRKVDAALREVDPDFILMFEPTPFPDVWPVPYVEIRGGFSEAPLPSGKSDFQMFNFHSYCCNIDLSICAAGEPSLQNSQRCREHHFLNAFEAKKFSTQFGFGAILTEFGACSNTLACKAEISSVADAADAALVSWAYWMFKPFKDFTTICQNDLEGLWDKDGKLQEIKVAALTRSYMTAFQGKPKFMKYFVEEKVLIVKFYLDRKVKEPSVVYVNKELNYLEGVGILAWPAGAQVENKEENYFEIFYGEKDKKFYNYNNKEDEEATVIVFPKKEFENEQMLFDLLKEHLSDAKRINEISRNKFEL